MALAVIPVASPTAVALATSDPNVVATGLIERLEMTTLQYAPTP